MGHLGSKGQSTAEYAIVIALVIGMGIAMTPVVKRALQARNKSAVDALVAIQGTGDLKDFKKMEQYEPYYVDQQYNVDRSEKYKESITKGAISRSGTLSDVNRQGKVLDRGADSMNDDNQWK